mmetsp:Transcript_29800/g.33236  ORF Transcript_29800/g.33236 Transcript_29800/m.33236 type:complete len:256 (+) Transcript_29800:91-858(+)
MSRLQARTAETSARVVIFDMLQDESNKCIQWTGHCTFGIMDLEYFLDFMKSNWRENATLGSIKKTLLHYKIKADGLSFKCTEKYFNKQAKRSAIVHATYRKIRLVSGNDATEKKIKVEKSRKRKREDKEEKNEKKEKKRKRKRKKRKKQKNTTVEKEKKEEKNKYTVIIRHQMGKSVFYIDDDTTIVPFTMSIKKVLGITQNQIKKIKYKDNNCGWHWFILVDNSDVNNIRELAKKALTDPNQKPPEIKIKLNTQ